MSSKVNNALFELIQAMSKSEKRYFKLMSSRHTIGKENNYVRLFDFLDKLAKTLFTGKLTINFHKGNVGKVQMTKTIKISDIESL